MRKSAFGPPVEEAPPDHAQHEEEDQALLGNQEAEDQLPPSRGCCMRIICLLCCCVTKDLGSQAHLNALNEEEIALYQQQLEEEMKKRQSIKKPGADTSIN